MDNHAKAFGADRFGGYLVLWGTQKAKDVTGEFFTSHTQEMKSVFDAMGRLPVLYHHAADSTLKSQVIGHIDLMQPDEVGLWVEAQATKADLYRRMVKPLLDKGLLGWSSGTFPRAKEVKATGEITRWPIMEGSLTPTPADPRQMMRPVAAVKAAFVEIGLDADALKAYDDPTTAPDTDESIALLNLERERLAILELETQLAETVEKAGTFDESKHPRFPKGHPYGGRFMPTREEVDRVRASILSLRNQSKEEVFATWRYETLGRINSVTDSDIREYRKSDLITDILHKRYGEIATYVALHTSDDALYDITDDDLDEDSIEFS